MPSLPAQIIVSFSLRLSSNHSGRVVENSDNMRKISGRVVSTKPISLSRAAKLISRFAAVDNGSSPAVSMYLQRAADAFNHLVQFHDKRSKIKSLDNSPDGKSVAELQTDRVEKSLDEDEGRDSKKRGKKSDKKSVEAKDSETLVKEKKKKKRQNDEGELQGKSSRKKSRDGSS